MSSPSARPRLGACATGHGTRFAAFTDAPACSVRWFSPTGEVADERSLSSLGRGYFETEVESIGHGTVYRFVVGDRAFPDPYARFLPEGVHGPAMVVDPRHEWKHGCVSRPLAEHVIYELHVGTFTPQGTYASACSRLNELVELGVTTIELMPLAAFDGAWGWGYDGVAHFAPFAPYGTPDELRAFVDCAHGHGLSVFLDVVYNHFGPAGNYLSAYSSTYFTRDEHSPWGEAPNFRSAAMRQYVIDNANYWLEDFRFDGLRLDATHAIRDPSAKHVLTELAESVALLQPKRYLIAEDDRNDATLVSRKGVDALWADDFHHVLRVTLTRERQGYYANYEPGAEAIAHTVQSGWLFEGETYPATGRPRGSKATELAAERFVYCIQNHDQIGNRPAGDRLSMVVSTESYLAASLLLFFLPMVPLLFMGQEWAASTPFAYFTNHETELGRKISEGRRREFAGFVSEFESSSQALIPDPQSPSTFLDSRLDWNERVEGAHAEVVDFYRRALRLRRSDPVLRRASRDRLRAEAVDEVLIVRRWHESDERILLVNFRDEPVRLDDVVPRLGAATCLLATSFFEQGRLPLGAAAVFARSCD
jgi:maltooligosyltrehalose trehalohydrolase